MKDEKESSGLGMPAPTQAHQRVLGIMHKNYIRKRNDDGHFLMGVAVVDEPERIPDISYWENPCTMEHDATHPLLSIELTHTARNDRYSDRTIRETFSYVPSLRESFIYDFAQDTWIRYRREGDKVIKESDKDYSQVLGFYLHTLLNS